MRTSPLTDSLSPPLEVARASPCQSDPSPKVVDLDALSASLVTLLSPHARDPRRLLSHKEEQASERAFWGLVRAGGVLFRDECTLASPPPPGEVKRDHPLFF